MILPAVKRGVEKPHRVGEDFRGGPWGTGSGIVLSQPAGEPLCCTGTVYSMLDVNSIFVYILRELNVAFV